MKKALSLIIVLAMCLTVCLSLTSCGAEKNPYQTFLKSNGDKTYDISTGNSNDYPRDGVKDYHSRVGKISTSSSARASFDVDDTLIVTRNNDTNTTEYRLKRGILMGYDMRDTVLKVSIFSYAYDCDYDENATDSGKKWTDGFSLNASRNDTIVFEFDINKYFENGKLTADDAIGELTIDASKVSINKVGLDSKKFTERNPEWETKVIDDVLEIVNELLGEFDKIVEENN